jgi:hypothetical protein
VFPIDLILIVLIPFEKSFIGKSAVEISSCHRHVEWRKDPNFVHDCNPEKVEDGLLQLCYWPGHGVVLIENRQSASRRIQLWKEQVQEVVGGIVSRLISLGLEFFCLDVRVLGAWMLSFAHLALTSEGVTPP